MKKFFRGIFSTALLASCLLPNPVFGADNLSNWQKQIPAYKEPKINVTKDGPVLLFSDSPEMVKKCGIMYRDTVNGKVRIFFHHAKDLVYMLQKEVPGFKTLVQNINTRHTNVILGEKNKTIFGPGSIKDKLGDLSFNISAQSFFQVNSEQAQKLYDTALEYAKLTGKETVVDVYCGTGTITLFLAQKAKNVFGIEIVPSAIRDAKINAKENKIANANFILGDAAKELPNLLGAGVKPDVIVLDPPRAGCEVRVLEAIASVKPKRIVYVSCNPATLARDLVVLTKAKYKITKVQPVDMFPQTSHVESVCLMSRVQK